MMNEHTQCPLTRDYVILIEDRRAHRRGSIGIFHAESEEQAILNAQRMYPELFHYMREREWTPHAVDNGA